MQQTKVLIVGAGQFGLSMSRALSGLGIDHLVIDRGAAGEAWRSERWDSLKLLTPNWANGLPGVGYNGVDPDGYMTARDMAAQLEAYAQTIKAPLLEGTEVLRCRYDGGCYRVETHRGEIRAAAVVIATGAASKSHVPAFSANIPASVAQVTPDRYRRPSDLPEGRVLVVGAAATGVQLARELHLSGRDVTLAVGSHVRLPRSYRGEDIEHWLFVTGILDQLLTEINDVERARRLPAPQLVAGEALDLNALQSIGVEIVGRMSDVRDGRALFSGGLAHVTAAADLKMNRTLELVDAWIEEHGEPRPTAAVRPARTAIPSRPRLSIDLEAEGVKSVVWATGYRPSFAWLDVPVFDARGRLRHDGGVCEMPGLYVLGLPVLRRRRSHHISGAEADCRELSNHLAQFLNARCVA
ncbi:MAG: FAD-dependent oxidoreductase [Pseudomonadota bacterium]